MIQNDVLDGAKLEGRMEGRMERDVWKDVWRDVWKGVWKNGIRNCQQSEITGGRHNSYQKATGLSLEEIQKL